MGRHLPESARDSRLPARATLLSSARPPQRDGPVGSSQWRGNIMRHRRMILAATALALACIGAREAGAEVRVSGQPGKLVLHAKDANLTEIMAGLQSALRV